MARGYFQYGEPEWNVPASSLARLSPNIGVTNGTARREDGQLWTENSAGSGPFTNTYIQSTWSWNLNGMYQVASERPWGFNVAANLFGREGYPIPYGYTSNGVIPQLGNLTNRVTSSVDAFRNEDVFNIDLRLEKDMPLSDNLSSTFSLDVFNIFNENYVMQREIDLNSGQPDWAVQTLAPRVYRLGFRLSWR